MIGCFIFLIGYILFNVILYQSFGWMGPMVSISILLMIIGLMAADS